MTTGSALERADVHRGKVAGIAEEVDAEIARHVFDAEWRAAEQRLQIVVADLVEKQDELLEKIEELQKKLTTAEEKYAKLKLEYSKYKKKFVELNEMRKVYEYNVNIMKTVLQTKTENIKKLKAVI